MAERRAWPALAACFALAAVVAWPLTPEAIDWQPARAAQEPWRAWSAAFVHYSGLHLAANLAGALLVGALGHVARVPGRTVAAWALAWPLTQALLLLQPSLAHYGGLSGVLHAGVAVVAVHLLFDGPAARRRIAAAIVFVLVAKLVGEAPFVPVRPSGWDITVAPFAHATGALAGAICAIVAELLARARPTIGR